MKKIISLIIFCFVLLNHSYSQQSTDQKQVFLAAESYFLFEEFDEALPLYLKLNRANPDNFNLYFKIGVCYLNNPYEKEKSVFYLEKAAKNINSKYKESTFKELGAPQEAMFYLGNAYLINNNLDKARESYNKFLSLIDPKIYDDKLVREQLTACDVAEKLMKKPVDLDIEIISNKINTRFAEQNATVSGDETKMVFISKLQFYDAVFYTEKVNGEWTPPRNITPELGVDGDVYPTCLSYDGTLLFIYRSDDFIGNIYSSKLVNGSWTPLVKLNENINTKFWESHASITKDNKTLYFTSNRKGGFGGLDIYKSEKQPNGDWGPAVNLGPTLNSAYNEETPFITENGRRLFFSSYGHFNMGGYDVFTSVLKSDNTWETPLNLGYPVNTTDDNVFFCPVKDGEIAYYSVYRENGYGKSDIYRYKVYTADHPRRFDISGILNYSGRATDGSDINIIVLNSNNGDTLVIMNPNSAGKFTLNLPAGKYNLIFDSNHFEKVIRPLEIAQNTPHTGTTISDQIKLTPLPEPLTPEQINNLLIIHDSLINVTKGKPIKIDYDAEKGSVVIIRQYLDSVLVKTDTVNIEHIKNTYTITPQPGLNKVEFQLTDKNKNKVTKTVTINYPKENQSDTSSPATIVPASEDTKGIPQENFDALLNELIKSANGNLKEVLKGIDTDKEKINSTDDLISYLNENADKLGIDPKDINALIYDIISKKDLEEFLASLKNASSGNLKTTISELNTKNPEIKTAYEAVDYLIRNSTVNKYSPEDVVRALSTVAENGVTDQPEFIRHLQNVADDPLASYLKTLDLNSLQTNNPQDFSVSLYRNSSARPYSEADVLHSLTKLAVSRPADAVLKKLILLADEGSLKDFLKTLDLEKEGIYTAEQLLDFIYANAGIKGYTTDEVNQLLQKLAYNQISEINDFRLKMAALATGNLKDYLEKLNLNDYSFGSREEFLEFLKSQAALNNFTEDDVNNILLKLAYSGDLDNIKDQLISLADGNLKKTLEKLDLKKNNISSFEELIKYLLDNSDKFGYSKEDVYNLLADYTAATDLKLFLDKLIRLSDYDTKIYLENLDLKTNGIKDRTDLISFLLKQGETGVLNEEKLIQLLLNGTDPKLTDVLKVLQSRSIGELNKILKSDKLPLNEIANATELYNYLLTEAFKNKALNVGEINKLFSEYLIDNSLNQFLAILINNTEGSLKEFLLKTDLKINNINSVADLIKFIFKNAAANNYSEQDVIKMISKVLEQGKLENFISRLKQNASGGLRKLLNQLDFEKEGINSIEDLLKYLKDHASEYGYTMDDVWNAISNLTVSEDKILSDSENNSGNKNKVEKSDRLIYSMGIITLAALTVVIIIILIYKRRRKEQK